jgi:peptide methionine sulfoxide reductase MsrB
MSDFTCIVCGAFLVSARARFCSDCGPSAEDRDARRALDEFKARYPPRKVARESE